MARRSKKFYGYQREVPENLSIVEIDKTINIPPFGDMVTEKRFIIVDMDTGEIFDDAQGYGYKTEQKAKAALRYKSQSKEKFDKMYEEQDAIKLWCSQHKSIVRLIGEERFMSLKEREPFTVEDMKSLLIIEGIDVKSLPFILKKLYDYV